MTVDVLPPQDLVAKAKRVSQLNEKAYTQFLHFEQVGRLGERVESMRQDCAEQRRKLEVLRRFEIE